MACAGPQIIVDYDHQTHFDSIHSYAFYPNFESGLGQLDEKRFIRALEDELRNKGLKLTPNADIYVNVYSQEYEKDKRDRLGIGVGAGGGVMGVGISKDIPIGGLKTYLEITIDFVKVEEDALVWQAKIETQFDLKASPEMRQEEFRKIVRKALKKYPPKS